MIAYEVPADAIDDYVCVGESTTLKYLRRFAIVVVELFGPQYLRLPSSPICGTRGKRGKGGRVGARVLISVGAAADAYKCIEACELLSFGDTLAALLDTSTHDDPWSFSLELVMNLQGESGEFRIWTGGKCS
jgi:hypothetical protein